MTHVQVQTRGSLEIVKIDDEEVVTVLDLKRKLNQTDPKSVLLTFKGKILTDSTPLSTLGENAVFTMEKDIEFAQTEQKGGVNLVRAIVNRQPMLLREDEIFIKDGKPFLITRRSKKLKLKDIIELIKRNVSKAQLVQLVFIIAVVMSRNYSLLAIILTINLLRMLSFILLKSNLWMEYKGHLSYSAFMFFASLVAIDYDKFIKKPVSK